jgi:competence protein ComEA
MGIPRWYWAAAFCLFAAVSAVLLIMRWQVIAQTMEAPSSTGPIVDALTPAPGSIRDGLPTQEQPAADKRSVSRNADSSSPQANAAEVKTTTKRASQAQKARGNPPPIPRLDLNRAGSAELQQLPGVGPVLANRIVSYRNLHGRFATYEDLDAVKGIGEKMLQKLRPYLYVK